MNQKTRDLVYLRDGERCAMCARRTMLQIHHRANRGIGGSKLMDGPANLLTLCWRCNSDLESDPDIADKGRGRGIKISKFSDPETIPVTYWDGTTFYLTDRGTRIKEM